MQAVSILMQVLYGFANNITAMFVPLSGRL